MKVKIEIYLIVVLGIVFFSGCGEANRQEMSPPKTPSLPPTLFVPSEEPPTATFTAAASPIRSTDTPEPPVPTPTLISTLPPVGNIIDSGQRVGMGWGLELGDLDGDGDLDILSFDYVQGNSVWLNDGKANFTPTDQQPGYSFWGALGDLDSDGDLDIINVEVNHRGSVWFNDGTGQFMDSGQVLTTSGCYAATLGDLDGDSDLDAYVACRGADSVWINDGAGYFESNGQRLGTGPTVGAALLDLEGDGDLDVLTGGWDEPQKLWLNDGKAQFTDSGQRVAADSTHIHAVALGDLDGDDDLDALLGLAGPAGCQLIQNDGTGVFSNWGAMLQSSLTHGVALGDLDEDGDLDAVTAHGSLDKDQGSGGVIWINDGEGHFQPLNPQLGEEFSAGVALGDLNGDGRLDIVISHGDQPMPAEIWLNDPDPSS